MKNIFAFSFILFLSLAFSGVQAQSNTTLNKEVTVTGVCGMCKERIENAALDVKGVKMATWSPQSQKLKVYYKTKHTDIVKIQEAIAAVGHDTEAVKAEEKAYKKLPDCCLYRDGVKVH